MTTPNDPIEPYVSSLDRSVFVVRNLPEEVIAVLFAYYSRSPHDLRTNLRRLIAEDLLHAAPSASMPDVANASSKARSFHERWVVGYGHGSVAEHASIHLAIEGCSIIAAKAIEDARVAAYTEKSTRYVRFGRGTLVTDIGLPEDLAQDYERGSRALLDRYTELADEAEALLAARYPVPDGVKPEAHANTLRAHALDLLRGLLPAGVPTNVGLTINARSLESHLSKLLASPLAEVRRIAAQMLVEGVQMLPSLLTYTAPKEHRRGVRDRVLSICNELPPPAAPFQGVTLVDATDDPLRTLAATIECELYGTPWAAAWAAASDTTRAATAVRSYLYGREKHDRPLRALEQVTFRFEICCDYGAWRDLQRHRMVSATTPCLGVHGGWWLSPEIEELGLLPKAQEALEKAAETYYRIAASHPLEAQYGVPLAYRVRYLLQANLRELVHLIELRTGRAGHESYRVLAQSMARHILSRCPWLEGLLRVDWNQYPFARA